MVAVKKEHLPFVCLCEALARSCGRSGVRYCANDIEIEKCQMQQVRVVFALYIMYKVVYIVSQCLKSRLAYYYIYTTIHEVGA